MFVIEFPLFHCLTFRRVPREYRSHSRLSRVAILNPASAAVCPGSPLSVRPEPNAPRRFSGTLRVFPIAALRHASQKELSLARITPTPPRLPAKCHDQRSARTRGIQVHRQET